MADAQLRLNASANLSESTGTERSLVTRRTLLESAGKAASLLLTFSHPCLPSRRLPSTRPVRLHACSRSAHVNRSSLAEYLAARPFYPKALFDAVFAAHRGTCAAAVDLGAGSGQVTQALAERVEGTVYAVDPSKGMLEKGLFL
jgi:SAM-dependent methyltransferase